MQDVDRPADVQPLSQPAGHGRPSVQVKSLRLMPRSQHVEGISWQRSNSRNLGKKSPVRTAEAQLSVGVSLDLVALFVNRAVMPTTENSEIRKCGRAAIRPVTDVMPLAETEAGHLGRVASIPGSRRTPSAGTFPRRRVSRLRGWTGPERLDPPVPARPRGRRPGIALRVCPD